MSIKPEGSYHLWLVALFIGVAGSLLFRLGDPPSQTAAEWRCRQVITGMVTTGDYLTPRKDGVPHLTKPPLYYWHAVFWSQLLGHAGRFQQRLPSVLCALGLLALTYVWGCSAGGPTVGLLSAVWLGLTTQLYSMGRRGTYDMQLALFCVAALMAADQYRRNRRAGEVPLFAALVVLAFLTKGPPAFLFIGLPILLYLIERRRLKAALDRRVWPWLLLIVPLSLSWFIAVALMVPQAREIFLSEMLLPVGVEIGRTTAHHYKTPFFYIERAPSLLFPVILLLPLVVRQAWQTRGWRHNPSLRFCFWAVSGPLVLLSIIPQKQPHFLLPLLAPLSVLSGSTLVEVMPVLRDLRWLYIPARILGFSCCAVAAAFLFFFWQVIPENPWLWGPCVTLLMVVGCVLLFKPKQRRWSSLWAMSLLATWAMVFLFFGSFNIWDLQFKYGVVFDRPDYQSEQWQHNFERYPWLQKIFRVKYHGERVIKMP